MAFTNKNDINIIQRADTENMGAGAGDDIYVIGMPESLLRQGQEVSITDATGNNTLRLIDDLTITSGVLGKTYVTLKFSNDSTITLLGADKNFAFGVGGDEFGRGETIYNFSEFVTNVLGKTIPQSGHLDIGKIIIGEDVYPDDYTLIPIDTGGVLEIKIFDASISNGKYKFIDDSTIFTNVQIINFSNDDVIQVINATNDDYFFTNEGKDVIITYNNDNGILNTIQLMGVLQDDDTIIDGTYQSFIDAIGFNVFSFS